MKLIYSFLIILMGFATFTISSCSEEKDPCEGVVCNNGACDGGTCACDMGYSGEDCSVEIRAQYLGTWSGPNTCTAPIPDLPLPEELSIEITAASTGVLDLELNLTTMAGTEMINNGQIVTLDGNAFVIEPITFDVPMIGEVMLSGDGIFRSNGELNFDFSIGAGLFSIPCSATLTKEE